MNPLSADVIDYKIHGSDLQFVEVELDPEEGVVAEAGAMMFMDDGIEMKTIFGDGSEQNKGFLGSLWSAGQRLVAGESLFFTVFKNSANSGKKKLSFAAPYPGKIIPVDLKTQGGEILCQRDSFLCAAKGVSVGIAFQKKILTGLFGGEGFILEKLKGDGLAFLHACGAIYERTLEPGEVLKVDTGAIVAFEPSVSYDIQMVRGISSMIFGGEGLFLATLKGPGKIYLQSMPFSNLAAQIVSRIKLPGHANASARDNNVGGLNMITNMFDGK
jgi:uncharacterized protein (TIGR00266 family)